MMTMKIQKPLAVIAAVVVTLLLVVSMEVPAFAAESDMTTQNNEQFEIVDPKYEGDANNYVTLPDAPAKDGYTFKGWSIDSSTELHHAGESIVNNDSATSIHDTVKNCPHFAGYPSQQASTRRGWERPERPANC